MLRKKGVVGKFVEFFGAGPGGAVAGRPRDHRQHGARVRRHLRHLPGRRRDAALPAPHRPRGRRRSRWSRPTRASRGCSTTPTTPEADYSRHARARSRPPSSRASPGPKRPQDRVRLFQTRKSFADALPSLAKPKAKKKPAAADAPLDGDTNVGYAPASTPSPDVKHGSVVIAAITSCTNTSNPSVMIAAGLLAKKAVETGLCDQAVGEDVAGARLEGRHRVPGRGRADAVPRAARLPPRRLRLHDLHRQLRPAARADLRRHRRRATWWSPACCRGNRNFEGRINPDVRANYLTSPPLVVAYALAGRIDIDLDNEPLGTGKDGKPVFLRDIWPSPSEVSEAVAKAVKPAMFQKTYARRLRGRRALAQAGRAARARPSPGTRRRPTSSTRRTSTTCPRRRRRSSDIKGARVLAVLGDSITTDHISPAGSIKKDGPAGKYLIEHGVDREGLQLLRRPPRQPRGDGARHVRQRAPQEPARARHRGRRDAPPARRRADVDLRRLREVRGRGRAARRSSPARSTARARRATGRPRGRACSACAP